MQEKICKFCGINLELEAEMFGKRGHSCRGSEEQMILNTLSGLRQNGIPCLLVRELTTPELEKQIIPGEWN